MNFSTCDLSKSLIDSAYTRLVNGETIYRHEVVGSLPDVISKLRREGLEIAMTPGGGYKAMPFDGVTVEELFELRKAAARGTLYEQRQR